MVKLRKLVKENKRLIITIVVGAVSFIGLYTPDGDEYFSQPGRQHTRLYSALLLIGGIIFLCVMYAYFGWQKRKLKKGKYDASSTVKESGKRR